MLTISALTFFFSRSIQARNGSRVRAKITSERKEKEQCQKKRRGGGGGGKKKKEGKKKKKKKGEKKREKKKREKWSPGVDLFQWNLCSSVQ